MADLKYIFILATICVFVALPVEVHGQKSYVEIYERSTINASNAMLRTSYDEANLRDYASLRWVYTTNHAIVYSGAFIVYSGANFSASGFTREPCFGICESTLGMVYISIRFPGLTSNYSASSLSLYEREQYVGEQQVHVNGVEDITFPFHSFYKTGNEAWTIYLGTNYTGGGMCVQYTSSSNIAEYGFVPGQIKSAREGCLLNKDEDGNLLTI